MTMRINLPWPDRDLHPNARVHWTRRHKAARIARETAFWTAKEAGIKPLAADALSVTAIFTPPDNRRRDLDGMLASVKASMDGLADAIGVDDSKWSLAIRREAPCKPGSVRIEIEVAQ